MAIPTLKRKLRRSSTVRAIVCSSSITASTIIHCHQQNHMDLGFMTLLDYA
jgi:hypothetical protein